MARQRALAQPIDEDSETLVRIPLRSGFRSRVRPISDGPHTKQTVVEVVTLPERPALGAQLLWLFGMLLCAAAIFRLGALAYRVWTDAQVKPLLLSSDNEFANATRRRLNQLISERDGIRGRIDDQRTAIDAVTRARAKLEALQTAASRGAGRSNAAAKPRQRRAALDLVRIELELVTLETEVRSRSLELEADLRAVQDLEQRIAGARGGPLLRAIEDRQAVAFVPYTRNQTVRAGSWLYECTLGGILGCERVGRVSAVLPDEVRVLNVSGAPARGQYAVLELWRPSAAHARALRVRAGG